MVNIGKLIVIVLALMMKLEVKESWKVETHLAIYDLSPRMDVCSILANIDFVIKTIFRQKET